MKRCLRKHTSYHHIIQFLNSKTSCNKRGLPRESRFHDSHPLKSPYLKCHWLQKSLQFWKKNLCSCGTCAKRNGGFCGKCKGIQIQRTLIKETVSKQLAPLVPPNQEIRYMYQVFWVPVPKGSEATLPAMKAKETLLIIPPIIVMCICETRLAQYGPTKIPQSDQ